MASPLLSVWQVKRARQRAWDGENAKEIAGAIGVNYGPVYNAIRGVTWSSITDPPPLPAGTLMERKRRPVRTCGNCGEEYRKGGTTERCPACYTYLRRHGTERNEHQLRKHPHTRISLERLKEIYREYETGTATDTLAEDLPFSAETLRRRFKENGFELRPRYKQRLTPGMVRHAREQVHNEGVPIFKVAEELGVVYQTLYTAVMGETWRAVGGPLPDEGEGELTPCENCSVLSKQRLCRYCRKER